MVKREIDRRRLRDTVLQYDLIQRDVGRPARRRVPSARLVSAEAYWPSRAKPRARAPKDSARNRRRICQRNFDFSFVDLGAWVDAARCATLRWASSVRSPGIASGLVGGWLMNRVSTRGHNRFLRARFERDRPEGQSR